MFPSFRKANQLSRCLRASKRNYASVTSTFFPHEPLEPILTSSTIPGPLSKQASSGIDSFQDSRAHILVANYEKFATALILVR